MEEHRMGSKIGVDLGGTWVRVGVLEPGPNGDTLRIEKHASAASSWLLSRVR